MKIWLHRAFQQAPYLGWAVLLFLLACLQFSNTLSHDYAWDDAIVIVDNPRVQAGISSIPEHFQVRTRATFSDFSGYRPITMSSFAVDQSIAPLEPSWGHLMNVLLFALLCVVLFYTLRQVFPTYHPAFSFCVTFLFLVHPVHVEVVANIKSRDEIFALLFGLLALQSFVRHLRGKSVAWLLLSTLCLLLAAWSKETGYFMTGVLGLAAIVLGENSWRNRGLNLLKLFGQVLVLVLVVWLVTGKPPGIANDVDAQVYQENMLMGNALAVDAGDHSWRGTEGYLLALYLKDFFFPIQQVYYSGFAQIPRYELTHWVTILATLLLLSLLGFGIWGLWKKRCPEIVFGWWFFLLTVAFFLQPFGFYLADAKADRFLFMPSVGLCLLVVGLLYRLMGWRFEHGPQEWWKGKKTRVYLWAGFLVLVGLLLAGKTWQRNLAWKDNLTLFSTDMPKLENCAKAHFYYANALREQLGARTDGPTRAEIHKHYRRAIEITPWAYFSYVQLGADLMEEGRFAEIESLMTTAIETHPEEPEVHALLGQAQYALGKPALAVHNLEIALRGDQGPDETWEFLVRSLVQTGDISRAETLLAQALSRNAGNPYLWDAQSDLYYDTGRVSASFPPILKNLEIDGNNPIWWKKLIGRFNLVGDTVQAQAYYRQARERGVLP